MIVDLKIISDELLSSVDLSRAQNLYIYKAIKIVVICKDKYFILAMFLIVTPYFEGFDNS